MFPNFSSNLPTEVHFCESFPSLVSVTKLVARYMEISVYLAISLVARYMEISMYLARSFVARYMEISMYLATKLVARYMEISMYLATTLVARYMEISVYFAISLFARYMEISMYSGTPLIRTPTGPAQVSVLTGCPYYAGCQKKRYKHMFYRRKDPSRHFFTVTNALILLKLQQGPFNCNCN